MRGRARGSVTLPTRTQIQPTTPVDKDGSVKCTGHNRRCERMIAGPTSKNPGRAFYACPLKRDDPNKCKFFLWEDEMQGKTPQKANNTGQTLGGQKMPPGGGHILGARQTPGQQNSRAVGEQILGQSPQARFGRPNAAAPPVVRAPSDDLDELEWDKVDTDELERDAIASTPGSSQRTEESSTLPGMTIGTSFQDRLKAATEGSANKRKREDDEATPQKPKVDLHNPFLSVTTTPRSPSHPILTPAIASLEQVSTHIQRQDRLLNAAEQMKQGLRKTISNLQDENKALKDKVKELEAKLLG